VGVYFAVTPVKGRHPVGDCLYRNPSNSGFLPVETDLLFCCECESGLGVPSRWHF
jgi:hypothetical protein